MTLRTRFINTYTFNIKEKVSRWNGYNLRIACKSSIFESNKNGNRLRNNIYLKIEKEYLQYA